MEKLSLDRKFTKKEINWIKSRNWFNDTGDKLINSIKEGIQTAEEKIDLDNEIIELIDNSALGKIDKYIIQSKETLKEIEKENKEISIRKYILSRLEKNLTINDIING